jgi:AraC-like DNA-binding protein/ribosomal protein S18 acetylase RimI-like enzyme
MKILDKVRCTVRYIEENLGEKLDLSTISAAADLSPYHLHRLFAGATGITIHEYLRRRRLTEAARQMMTTDQPIIEAAIEAGYESQQAFSRVFREIYKLPPAQFRRTARFYPLQLPYDFDHIDETQCIDSKSARPQISFAEEKDINDWMRLVRLVIDGYPLLDEKEHALSLKNAIHRRHALIARTEDIAVGIMIISSVPGEIHFLGIHPLFRNMGIAQLLLGSMFGDFAADFDAISITTYRNADKADTGHRHTLKSLGFIESQLLTELGYPTQRFLLPRCLWEKRQCLMQSISA